MEVEVFTEEVPKNGSSSIVHATFNSLGVMLGISFLSAPYALVKGGWLGITILLAFGAMNYYTAILLGRCMVRGGARTYREICLAAFGKRGLLPFTCLFCFELVAVLVGYTISLGDNLARLFPHATIKVQTLEINPSITLLILVFIIILPTVWARDLAWMSYLSLVGIVIYIVVAFTIVYVGAFNGLGFHCSISLIRPGNLPSISGIYTYCFAGHCVFPSIYTSLKNPSNYPKVLMISFILVMIFYSGFAILGATMFGEAIISQVSLNIPTTLVAAKIVLWLVVLLPFTKYSLCIAPMALELETKFLWPQTSMRFRVASLATRTSILVLIFVLAMALPYFATMVSFIGSGSGMLLAIVLPCAFYLKLLWPTVPKWEMAVNVAILTAGMGVGTLGTFVSIKDFVHKF